MTRLESGAIHPNVALHDVSEVVGTTLRRAAKILRDHPTRIDLAADLPMVLVDPVLFEQVLFNLLDNAAKYAPPGTTILVRGWADGRDVVLQILDEGPGIPRDDLERVFDSFYRVRKGDHVRAGTGLGLSICRGFIKAMGGTISADNRMGQTGAVFTLRLPAPPGGARAEPLR